MRDFIGFGLTIGLLVIAFGLVAALLLAVTDNDGRMDSFQNQCAERGGHIYVPDNVAFCLTDDGRFVEVYP
jgi:hypothetical protein